MKLESLKKLPMPKNVSKGEDVVIDMAKNKKRVFEAARVLGNEKITRTLKVKVDGLAKQDFHRLVTQYALSKNLEIGITEEEYSSYSAFTLKIKGNQQDVEAVVNYGKNFSRK